MRERNMLEINVKYSKSILTAYSVEKVVWKYEIHEEKIFIYLPSRSTIIPLAFSRFTQYVNFFPLSAWILA